MKDAYHSVPAPATPGTYNSGAQAPKGAPPNNAFRQFWDLGFNRLVPIIPPDAGLSERSHIRPEMLGKIPGTRGRDGKWSGLSLVKMESKEAFLDEWAAMGAGVGVKLGAGLIAIDIDTRDPERSAEILRIAREVFGLSPVRLGQAPKAALLYRVAEDVAMPAVTFDTGLDERAQVEFPGEGRQIVVHGLHPRTGRPYTWPEGLPRREDLPEIDRGKLEVFSERLLAELPSARTGRAAERKEGETDPATLLADPEPERAAEIVGRIVRPMPNSGPHAEDRIAYVTMAYAIKAAAGPSNEAEARDLFLDWCARWEDGENDLEDAAALFDGLRPPYRAGIGYLLDRAAEQSIGEAFFTDESDAEIPNRPDAKTQDAPAIPLRAAPLDWDAMDRVPPREWLYGRKVLRKFVSFVVAPGGVGKTAYSTAVMLACAANRNLVGDVPVKQLRVWVLNLEDPLDEVLRRTKAAASHFGIGPEVAQRLWLNSGRDRPVCIAKPTSDGGTMVHPDAESLVAEMKRNRIDLLIVDPFLRSHGVSENDNEAQDEVMRIYAQIADRANAGIVLVHHTKKGGVAGEQDSMRGASAQGAGARSVFTLSPMSADEARKMGIPEDRRRRHVRVDDAKANMTPPMQRAEWIFLESVALHNPSPDYPDGDQVQVATRYCPPEAWDGLAEGAEREMLLAIAEGPGDGERYSNRSQDERWAGRMLMQQFDRSEAQAKELLKGWEAAGTIIYGQYTSLKQSKPRKGLTVSPDAISRGEPDEMEVFG